MEKENFANQIVERTNQTRLEHSGKGDEIILGYEKPNITDVNEKPQQLQYRTYIAIDNGIFQKAKITKSIANEKVEKHLQLEGNSMSAEQVFNEWNQLNGKVLPFWNRKKFSAKEVDELKTGKILQNYNEICEEYNPEKRIADMQLNRASYLQSITPNSEVNYYKFKDGEQNGIDSYICIKRYEFLRLNKKIMANEKGRELIVEADRSKILSVWDIVNTLPKPNQKNQLSPSGEINLRCKWNKYTSIETEKLKKGMVLSDTVIEKRRQLYLTSNHYFVPQKSEDNTNENNKPFLECWVDKETNSKLIHSRPVQLNEKKIERYQKEGRIKSAEEIPGLAKGKEKAINIIKRNGTGIER